MNRTFVLLIVGNAALRVELVPIDRLRPHEAVVESRVAELINDILGRGALIRPILVDEETMTILDGHHRVEALKRIGKRRIPAVLVNYLDDLLIEVTSWRDGVHISKLEVLRRALRGELYPPKTTRHIVKFPVPDVNVALDLL